MRLFDVVGAVVVVGWVSLVGFYVYERHSGGVDPSQVLSSEVVMHEGETWLNLRRADTDVGFVHETRTMLVDGWLIEYNMVLLVSMLGAERAVQMNVKASIDADAVLRQFSAEVTASSHTFRALGQVSDDELTVTTYLTDSPSRRTIALTEPPRLSVSAVNQFLASPDLKPGATIRQQFFDPTSMGMTTMDMKYVGTEEVEVWEETHTAHIFHQSVAGSILESFVDERGEMLIQTFPLGIIGSRVPPELGRVQASSIRQKIDAAQRETRGGGGGMDLSLETALSLFGGAAGTDSTDEVKEPGHWVISNVSKEMELQLESARQRVVSRDGQVVTIVVGSPLPEVGVVPLDDEEQEALLASTARVDAGHASIAALMSEVSTLELSVDSRAQAAAQAVHLAMKPEPNVALMSASEALDFGRGDCTEYALVLVAALRHIEIPARFVHGVIAEAEQMTPHQWVQYWNGSQFVDLDATLESKPRLLGMSGPTGANHIQLFVSIEPEHPNYVHVLDKLKIK